MVKRNSMVHKESQVVRSDYSLKGEVEHCGKERQSQIIKGRHNNSVYGE